MVFGSIDGVEANALGLAGFVFEIMMDAILYVFDEHRIAELCVPRDVEIDFAVDIFGHRIGKAAEAASRGFGRTLTSRKTAGLFALRASLVNEAQRAPPVDDLSGLRFASTTGYYLAAFQAEAYCIGLRLR